MVVCTAVLAVIVLCAVVVVVVVRMFPVAEYHIMHMFLCCYTFHAVYIKRYHPVTMDGNVRNAWTLH